MNTGFYPFRYSGPVNHRESSLLKASQLFRLFEVIVCYVNVIPSLKMPYVPSMQPPELDQTVHFKTMTLNCTLSTLYAHYTVNHRGKPLTAQFGDQKFVTKKRLL